MFFVGVVFNSSVELHGYRVMIKVYSLLSRHFQGYNVFRILIAKAGIRALNFRGGAGDLHII